MAPSQPHIGVPGTFQTVLTSDQIQRRVADLARQINGDYAGKTVYAVCVLEDGFMFMADLVRQLDMPLTCQFVKPDTQQVDGGEGSRTEIFFSPEVDVEGGDVLLVCGLIQTGVTTEFLARNLLARGASSVKVCTLLDRQSGRRVMLQPDYFGFLVDDKFVFGYGLGAPDLGRNLPYLATTKEGTVRNTP
ncbi:MAG TPA: phosphoribosyltransferase family protein [Terriglobales bacterium]|nr:phosphoribosyltransferase family protein [Terriglobales bacterium]